MLSCGCSSPTNTRRRSYRAAGCRLQIAEPGRCFGTRDRDPGFGHELLPAPHTHPPPCTRGCDGKEDGTVDLSETIPPRRGTVSNSRTRSSLGLRDAPSALLGFSHAFSSPAHHSIIPSVHRGCLLCTPPSFLPDISGKPPQSTAVSVRCLVWSSQSPGLPGCPASRSLPDGEGQPEMAGFCANTFRRTIKWLLMKLKI